jgi:nitroimidazol reductase NimA-like FMN-containing flavoprotein (pyridoxamine 5'-phosphate oxidase superfamily)
MVIRELTRQASLDLLTRIHIGRLAIARANQPYVFPIFFAYHQDSLYCATTIGQKIEWMRENPLVAVEVDEIESAQHWESVIVTGRYEEFADTPETRDRRQLAWSLLQNTNALWWEPGYVETILGGAERPMVPLYFRIRVGTITGHRATKE